MFHAGGHKGINTRGRSSALSRHYPHFLSHVDWKAPLRCGILFCTFSCILFVIGIILTWLGIRRSVHDMFGESVPITGPILLSVGGLMLLLALRQFYMAHTRKQAHTKVVQAKEVGVTAITAIAEQDEEQAFIEADTDLQKAEADATRDLCVNTDGTSEKPPLVSGSFYDSSAFSSPCGDTINSGSYFWPPVPLQHPYYSMAMMVYKDPALVCAPHISSPGHLETYFTGPIFAANTNKYGHEVGEETGTSASVNNCSSPPLQQRDSAVLETSSVTLQQPISPSSCSSPSSDSGSRLECSRIFPADYLTPYQRNAISTNSASAGIGNLPNPTAFMMLRTLELQETI